MQEKLKLSLLLLLFFLLTHCVSVQHKKKEYAQTCFPWRMKEQVQVHAALLLLGLSADSVGLSVSLSADWLSPQQQRQSVNAVFVNSSGLRALSDTLPDTETQIRAGDSSQHDTTWKDAAILGNNKFLFIRGASAVYLAWVQWSRNALWEIYLG